MSSDERALEATGLIGREVPAALARGDIRVLGMMTNASNETLLVRCDDGARGVPAIYKPRRGELPLWDFPDGTLHRREAAAYSVARSLGWPNVPPTVIRDGPWGVGSVQLFVEADPEQHYFTLGPEYAEELRRVTLFDVVANNADRKAGHCLLDESRAIWVIDHGVCFAEEAKLRTVIWAFAGEPIAAPLLHALSNTRSDLERGAPLRAELTDLLSAAEVDAMARRLDALLERATFPFPGPGRPFPWPPI